MSSVGSETKSTPVTSDVVVLTTAVLASLAGL
jgi:hypothetical protein